MKKKYVVLSILLLSVSFLYSQTYEPVEMKSGGLIGKNNLRFLLNWSHIEYSYGMLLFLILDWILELMKVWSCRTELHIKVQVEVIMIGKTGQNS